MKTISHRGNIDGANKDRENHPDYIKEALDLGFDVEIDVWQIDNKWYLGHDEPQYDINFEMNDERLWIHAKNVDALSQLHHLMNPNYFWHQNDEYTLTSKGIIWAYPGKPVPFMSRSIAVLPELYSTDIRNFYGVCTDYVTRYV